MRDPSWAPECPSERVARSRHRLGAFGEASVSFPMVWRFPACSLGGDAELHEASVKPGEDKGLVPPGTLFCTSLE